MCIKVLLLSFEEETPKHKVFIPKLTTLSRVFRYAFDLLIFINAFIIGFDVDEADWFFLVAFMLEILVKLYVFGLEQFFLRLWNV